MVPFDSQYILMFNSSIWPNSAPLRDIRLRNVSDLEFDLSRLINVKCHSKLYSPYMVFLLMFISNVWPNSALCQAIRLRNISDLDFEFSITPMVKSNGVIGLPIYDFLLMYNSNHMSIPHRLAVLAGI